MYKQFADDTTIYYSSENLNTCVEKINGDLLKIDKWCEENNMCLNTKKTKAMIFGKSNSTKKLKIINLDVHINENKISPVRTYKYLGITLDQNLTFNSHINQIIKNSNHKIFMLKRIRQYLTVKSSILVYKNFILPVIEYGSILYMTSNKKLLDRLQTIQNFGLKCCLQVNKRTDTYLIHKSCNINYLKDRRECQLLKAMFLREKEEEYKLKRTEGVQTRSVSTHSLYVPHFLSDQAQKSVMYRGATLWNNQSPSLRCICDKKNFNAKMKQILEKKRSEYIRE